MSTNLTMNTAHPYCDEASSEEMPLSKAELEKAQPNSLDRPLSSLLNDLLANIQAVEEQYAVNIAKAVEDLTYNVRSSSPDDGVEWIMSVRKEFEERVLAAYAHWNSQRQKVSSEIGSLDIRWTEKRLIHEIAQTELAIETAEGHIQWMLRNTSIDLSRIMRARAWQTQMKAYLLGLKFQAGMPDAQPLPPAITQ